MPFLHELKLTNVLSYGPSTVSLVLKDLNVLIGPNGSGKSNLIEAVSLLQSAPKALAVPVRETGGIRDWLWKGGRGHPEATVEAVLDNPSGNMPLRHTLAFTDSAGRFELVDEAIENERPYDGQAGPYFYYRYEDGHPVLNVVPAEPHNGDGNRQRRGLKREEVDSEQSILSQRKDPDQYPEITYLADVLGKIRIYREWSFGRYTPARLPQKADMRNDYLLEDYSNLGLVLNRLRQNAPVKKRLLELLGNLYEGVEDFDVNIQSGYVQVNFQESGRHIPAMRLSDGTLRFLCLLTILLDPAPPPLVCIEEPELGLHPDLMPTMAELLIDASERMQLIVTTHSADLVDEFTSNPEVVVVVERGAEGTSLQRQQADELKVWLEEYRLGQLWRRGDIGGTRW